MIAIGTKVLYTSIHYNDVPPAPYELDSGEATVVAYWSEGWLTLAGHKLGNAPFRSFLDYPYIIEAVDGKWALAAEDELKVLA